MINKPSDKPTDTDSWINDDPPPEKWYLKCENYREAQLALYAAKAQLREKPEHPFY
jgi:hypothetical protein